MKKILNITLIVLFISAFLYTIFYLYKKDNEPDMKYETVQPFYTDIIEQTVATGSVLPRKEILIKPQVSGIVEKIFVEPGQQVKSGDVLARIKVIPNMSNLNNAENRLERARIDEANAKIDFDRNKQLLEKGVIPPAQFQQFDMAYKSAKQEMVAAEDNLAIILEGASKSSKQTANTLIRSTISGTVLDVPVEEGNSVIEANTFNEGTTIASIADLSDMIFEGKVDESEVGKLSEGLEILLNIGAIDGQDYVAKLEYISPKGVEEDGAIQFEIKAALNVKEGAYIRAGYSANAKIVLNKRDSVMAIKERCLVFQNDSTFVEVETGNQEFTKRLVKLGLSDGINIEILSGLTLEDKVKDAQAVIE